MRSELKYFQLETAWNEHFSPKEQKMIADTYAPFSTGPAGKTILSTSQTRFAFFSGLLDWFKKPEHYMIGLKLIDFIEKNRGADERVLDVHFYLQNKIQFFYRNRDLQTGALQRSIDACLEQIAISQNAANEFMKQYGSSGGLPIHIGYKQLAIVYDKQGAWRDLISLCEKAKRAAWNGDWDKRIDKAKKKLSG